MIREFKLLKTDALATVEILEIGHIAQVLALQDETRQALSDEQKMFVLPQKAEYFEKLLTRKNGLMIGVRCNGQLVAQMALMGTMTLDEAILRNAITRNDVSFHHAEPTDLVVIAKSMAVHPQWRGNELSQSMLEAVLELPSVRAADHVFAQVSAHNVRSWELFVRHGFGIVAAAIDPIDKQPRFIVQKPALGFAYHPIASVTDIEPSIDFAATIRLTEREALIGQIDKNRPSFLIFYASTDTAAVWSDESSLLVGTDHR